MPTAKLRFTSPPFPSAFLRVPPRLKKISKPSPSRPPALTSFRKDSPRVRGVVPGFQRGRICLRKAVPTFRKCLPSARTGLAGFRKWLPDVGTGLPGFWKCLPNARRVIPGFQPGRSCLICVEDRAESSHPARGPQPRMVQHRPSPAVFRAKRRPNRNLLENQPQKSSGPGGWHEWWLVLKSAVQPPYSGWRWRTRMIV